MLAVLLLLCLMLTGVFYSPLHTLKGIAAEAASAHRGKRCYSPNPNYPLTVYSHLANQFGGEGEWKELDCNVTYNCEKVSPQHCNPHSSQFFCSNNEVSDLCIIDFDVNPLDEAGYSAADLALYKAEEPGTVKYYLIYIIHIVSETRGYLVAYKAVSSLCSGWQVFHLDDFVTQELNETTKFRLLVSTISYEQLTCQEISDLFILKADYDEEIVTSGDQENSKERKRRDEEGTSAPELILPPLDKRIEYIPTLNLFIAGANRTRREAPGDGEDADGEDAAYVEDTTDIGGEDADDAITGTGNTKKRCRRVEKLSALLDYVEDSTNTVVQPQLYDVGECLSDSAQGQQQEGGQALVCAPTKYGSVLAHLKTTDKFSQIVSLPDIVIKECGWVLEEDITL